MKRMKIIIGLFPVLCTVFMLSSCEKVIDLDLNSVEKKYVVEAVVTDQPGTCKVLLSQTKDFDQDNTVPAVSGASILLTGDDGSAATFTEVEPGVYTDSSFTGASGHSYDLSVTAGNQVFTAVSRMPVKVALDTIYVTDEFLFTDFRKIVNAVYTDPATMGNNYRFVQYVNGLKENTILIQNDDYTNGNTVFSKLFFFADDDDDAGIIDSGDSVRIEMQCIELPVYKYWFSLSRSALGDSNQATPSNPVSNLQGGALGYFSAHTLQVKEMIVP